MHITNKRYLLLISSGYIRGFLLFFFWLQPIAKSPFSFLALVLSLVGGLCTIKTESPASQFKWLRGTVVRTSREAGHSPEENVGKEENKQQGRQDEPAMNHLHRENRPGTTSLGELLPRRTWTALND